MRTFKDNEGRPWEVVIDVHQVKRVRDLLGVNLHTALANDLEGYTKIVGDPVALVDVLYCLCQKQCDTRKITDEDFGRAMAGDVLINAEAAFTGALLDFFPTPQRTTLGKVLQTARLLAEVMQEQARIVADAITPSGVMQSSAPSTSSPG